MNSFIKKEPKIYGAVQSNTKQTQFVGFCKKTNDNSPCEIDIYLDEKKNNTILANQVKSFQKRYLTSNENGFCFTYTLQEEYLQNVKSIEFKTKDGNHLMGSPMKILKKNDPLYNKRLFIESLENENIFETKKLPYTKNNISFIAIKENLNDTIFIDYIFELHKNFNTLSFNIIYFEEEQKREALRIFDKIDKKRLLNPSKIDEVIEISEIYIHNETDKFIDRNDKEYYNKIINSYILKDNVFALTLTSKYKKNRDTKKIKLSAICAIEIRTSIVSNILEEQIEYKNLQFFNKLALTNKKELDKITPQKGMGFFATDDNLNDQPFLNFIINLHEIFPNYTITAFCFDKICEDKLNEIPFVQKIIFNNFKQIPQNCTVFLTGTYSIKNKELFRAMFVKYNHIFLRSYFKLEYNIINYSNYITPLMIEKLKENDCYDREILEIINYNYMQYYNLYTYKYTNKLLFNKDFNELSSDTFITNQIDIALKNPIGRAIFRKLAKSFG